MIKNTGCFNGDSRNSNWSIRVDANRIIVNNNGMKLVAFSDEGPVKIIFDVENHKITAEVNKSKLDETPRFADMSDDIDFFNDLRGQLIEILHFLNIDDVKVNDDNTVFEITF